MKSLEEIVSAIADGTLRESETVDMKSILPRDLSISAKAIVGIANSGGGYFVLGLAERRDGSLSIIGIDDIEVTMTRLAELFDCFTIGIKYTPVCENINSKQVIIVQVEKLHFIAYFSRRKSSPERLTAYTRTLDGRTTSSEASKKKYKFVYKYMTLDAFIVSLYSKSWRFFEPNKWNDKFERRFYCANYQMTNVQASSTPKLYATCVTRTRNSEAAWKVYSHGEGLGSHCVQLELDVDKLRAELNSNDYGIAEKSVRYKSENLILQIHNRTSTHYNEYFSNFSLCKFLNLLTLKREAYSYEHEVRFFAIPKTNATRSNGNKSDYEDLKIDWSKVINKVRIDKACTNAELFSVQQACFSASIVPVFNPAVSKGWFPLPATKNRYKGIAFERFDIDAMPGSGRINIK
jgi:hypothetical protein